MKINFNIDVERSIIDTVTNDYLKECMAMAVSCMAQGNPKGIGMHPGMTIEWSVIRDEDGAL